MIALQKLDNYLNYIATRPRAQRIGSHGLFTGEEDSLVLAQIAEAVSTHPAMYGCLSFHCAGRMPPGSVMTRRMNGKRCFPSMPWRWPRQ